MAKRTGKPPFSLYNRPLPMSVFYPIITSYTLKELAMMYKVSPRTMKRRLKRLGILSDANRFKRIFFPSEVRLIFSKLGVPELTEKDKGIF